MFERLETIDWPSLETAYGTAEAIPGALRSILPRQFLSPLRRMSSCKSSRLPSTFSAVPSAAAIH